MGVFFDLVGLLKVQQKVGIPRVEDLALSLGFVMNLAVFLVVMAVVVVVVVGAGC